MRLLRTGMGIAKAAWNKAQDVVELKRRLAEANARVAELEASVEIVRQRSLGNRAYDDRLVEIASELHRIAHALKEPAE
jgi:hypothetical protein